MAAADWRVALDTEFQIGMNILFQKEKAKHIAAVKEAGVVCGCLWCANLEKLDNLAE